eukprot:145564-Amphidinium_carterae.2
MWAERQGQGRERARRTNGEEGKRRRDGMFKCQCFFLPESGKTLATLSRCLLALPRGPKPGVPAQVATHEGGAQQARPAAPDGVS